MASVNFQKCKSSQRIYAILRHCDKEQRQKYTHSNKQIDKAVTATNKQTAQNVRDAYRRYKNRIKEIDDAKDPETGKPINTNRRKDRVEAFALETAVPDVKPEDREQWAKDCSNIMANRFGKNNIVAIYLHKDEVHTYIDKNGNLTQSKWHLHALVVPELDGKLDGKTFSSKKNMINLNKELHKMTQERYGTRYMTGEDPERKTVEELKRLSAASIRAKEIKVAELDQSIDDKSKLVSSLDKGIATLKTKKQKLEEDNKVLQADNDKLQKQKKDLVNEIQKIEIRNADVLDLFGRSKLAGVPDKSKGIDFSGYGIGD